jgi:alpha-galactosidase
MFASWGVDYLKYDYCNAPDDFEEAIRRYTRMGQALKQANRSIVFSICEWGPRSPWLWGRRVGGQLWRTSFDVGDMWDTPHNTHSCIGILASIDAVANLEKHAGPGGWNDPDMLVVGLGNNGFIKGGGCNRDEYQTQMAFWCMLAAPLMIGCDIRHLDLETQQLLTNPELLALDQDELGQPGFRVARTGSTEVWKRNLAGGALAVALLNRGETEVTMAVDWKALGLGPEAPLEFRDLLSGTDLGAFRGRFQAKVRSHATVLLRAVPSPKPAPGQG